MKIQHLISCLKKDLARGVEDILLENDETGKLQDFIYFSRLDLTNDPTQVARKVIVTISPKS